MEGIRKLKTLISLCRKPGTKALTFRQIACLIAVYEEDALSMSEIGRRVSIADSQIKHNLRAIETEGYIEIRQSVFGGHVFSVHIKPQGKEFLATLSEVLK